MAEIRAWIEHWFETLARSLFRRSWLTLGLTLALSAALATQLPKLVIDTSNEGLLRQDDPTLAAYDRFRDQFGHDALITIALKPKKVFDRDFLAWLKELHQDLERSVPHLDEVTSLLNARDTRGEGDTLIVGDFLEKWPSGEADLAALEKRALSNPLYVNQLLSEDGWTTTIIIKTDTYSSLGLAKDKTEEALEGFDEQPPPGGKTDKRPYLTPKEITVVVEAVEGVLKSRRRNDVEVSLAGSPVVTDVFKRLMLRDIGLSIWLVIIAVNICLLLMFRRLSGVVAPFSVVGLALLSTLSIMAALGAAIKLPTMVLPAFVLAVGVGAAIHVMALFYQHFERNEDKEEAVVYALGHSGLAIVMTSLTTAAGLASFSTAEIAPVADLGIYASLGVLLALVYTVILLPALLAVIPIRREALPWPGPTLRLDDFLGWISRFSTSHPKAILAASLAVILVGSLGAARLHFSHNVLQWMPKDMPVIEATRIIDRELKGTVVVEAVLDTVRENGLHDPLVLKKLDELTKKAEALKEGGIFVGKGTSLADILKEINQALHENRPEFYAIPYNPALIPQEFLLFENSGSDDLEDAVDSRFQKARFTARVPWGDAVLYVPFLARMGELMQTTLGPEVKVTVTGLMVLLTRTISAAIHSMAKSYLIAIVVITLMMMLLIGSLKVGLIAMLPNLAPILLTMGFMGWLGFPLDLVTMLTGSIAIGLAVDDTVHFMHHFRRYYGRSNDVVRSVSQTLHTAGQAMLVTSVVLSLGFFVLMSSSMNNVFRFGLITGVTVILALLADFFMAPALMTLIHRPARAETKEV